MAAKRSVKAIKRVHYAFIHKLVAGVCLLVFFVIVLAGLMAGTQATTMLYLAAFALAGFKFVAWILIRVLSTYEEMNSGQT